LPTAIILAESSGEIFPAEWHFVTKLGPQVSSFPVPIFSVNTRPLLVPVTTLAMVPQVVLPTLVVAWGPPVALVEVRAIANVAAAVCVLDRQPTKGMLTVKIRQPSHEFTFGVGISFIPCPLVLTPVV
jgi:hypothetical protein